MEFMLSVLTRNGIHPNPHRRDDDSPSTQSHWTESRVVFVWLLLVPLGIFPFFARV